jgi:hypothetical protein
MVLKLKENDISQERTPIHDRKRDATRAIRSRNLSDSEAFALNVNPHEAFKTRTSNNISDGGNSIGFTLIEQGSL